MTITIQTNLDFTPKGKRTARVAPYGHRVIHWYVAGRIYNRLPITTANIALTNEWVRA